MKNQETITQENYDKSLELLNEMMDIIKEWELDGRSKYDRNEHSDSGNDEYEKDLDRLEELEEEWIMLVSRRPPLDGYENLQPYNHYKIYGIIQEIENMRIYTHLTFNDVLQKRNQPIKTKLRTLMRCLDSSNLKYHNWVSYDDEGEVSNKTFGSGLTEGGITERTLMISKINQLFSNELGLTKELLEKNPFKWDLGEV